MDKPQVAGHPYQVLANRIAAKIRAGELHPGDKLPSVRSLAKDSDVSAMTAQRALTQLANEGYAEVVAGLGYFVKEPTTPTQVTIETISQQVDHLQATVADLADRLENLETGRDQQ